MRGGTLSPTWQARKQAALARPRENLVTNERELAEVCREVANPDDTLKAGAMTLVPFDFRHSSIVFIGLGARPAHGFDVTLDSVVTHPSRAIYYTELTPGPCPTPQEVVVPFIVARVNAMKKPVRFVRVTRRDQHC